MHQMQHLRWEIEDLYKLLKSDGFSLRQLHAKSVGAVEQDLFTQLLLTAISRLLIFNAAAEHETPHCDLSAKARVLALASGIDRLLLCDAPERRFEHHGALLRRLARHRPRRRPGRSSPRRSCKPGPRWNSKGKAGD
ncbi:MAG: hypothetical protein ACK53T_06395 [Planctomycetota bacterium]